jgi:hypothetical protein
VVRSALVFIFLAAGLTTVRAQEQERRLVDRLLRPDMTLANSAQNKKFIAKGKTIEKPATVQSFYVSRKPQTKQFTELREYSATEFAAHHFRDGEMTSTIEMRAQRVKQFSVNDGTGALVVRDVSDGEKTIASSDFAGSRRFSDKGKSQKFLSQHNKPLTIEQVRELLNKNK